MPPKTSNKPQNNRRKAQTGEIVIWSEHPNQYNPGKQKNCIVQRLAEAGEPLHTTANAKTGTESSKNFFLSNLVSL